MMSSPLSAVRADSEGVEASLVRHPSIQLGILARLSLLTLDCPAHATVSTRNAKGERMADERAMSELDTGPGVCTERGTAYLRRVVKDRLWFMCRWAT